MPETLLCCRWVSTLPILLSLSMHCDRTSPMGCGASREVEEHPPKTSGIHGPNGADDSSESSELVHDNVVEQQLVSLDPVVGALHERREEFPPSPSSCQSIVSTIKDSQEVGLHAIGPSHAARPALSSNPNSVSAFSLESAHSSGNEPNAGPASTSSVSQSCRELMRHCDAPDVAFSSSSLFVPKDAALLTELRKRYQGGYRDAETDAYFPTRAQRYEILCAEVVGKVHPPMGNGLLFTHPNIYHGAPFPLEAFADCVAFTWELSGSPRTMCWDFLCDLPGFVHLAVARPTGAGEADLVKRSMARAQTYGLVKLQVILLELYTQMKDLQVLDAMPARFISAVKRDDISELRATYQERSSNTDPATSPTLAINNQGFELFLKREIFQNIHYCAMLGRHYAQQMLAELKSGR